MWEQWYVGTFYTFCLVRKIGGCQGSKVKNRIIYRVRVHETQIITDTDSHCKQQRHIPRQEIIWISKNKDFYKCYLYLLNFPKVFLPVHLLLLAIVPKIWLKYLTFLSCQVNILIKENGYWLIVRKISYNFMKYFYRNQEKVKVKWTALADCAGSHLPRPNTHHLPCVWTCITDFSVLFLI